MTKEQLLAQIGEIERIADIKKKRLYFEFVAENARFKIGDIIHDRVETIRVERIDFIIYSSIPSIYYEGAKLTQEGKPYQNGKRSVIYDTNAMPGGRKK